MSPAPISWSREARRLLPALRAWRTALHREPEVANEETKTRAKIVQWLSDLGLTPRTYGNFTGVSATLGEGRSGPCVAVRADMDGLPVTEATGLPFASRTKGRMHACGHDVHMACALGMASLLVRHESALRGPVRLIFQPAEEQGIVGGAGPFIERGVLRDPTVDFVLGQHVHPGLAAGTIGWRKNAVMASADRFELKVQGKGGHAAFPHRGIDTVLAASEVVVGLQAIVSRRRDPLDPVVITVGSVHGGTADNVLAREVVLTGTVRTLNPQTRDRMEELIRERSRLIARSLGASVRTEYLRGYPILVNSPRATEVVVRALTEEFGDAAIRELEQPVMGGEDFSRYLERVPGTFLFLGVGVPGRPAFLHSPEFQPPESVLPVGAAALAAAVEGLQGS